jgi:beta-lactamase regulating signal transducer with metallopeptidase domain
MSPLQNLAQLTSSQIANCFVLGTAIAALAGISSALVGRKSSALRFTIWLSALVGITSLFFFVTPGSHDVAASVSNPEISLRADWALYIFGLWAFFAAIGIGRLAHGLWRVRSLKRSCVRLDASLAVSFCQALPQASRKFTLCTSERLRVPAALGFVRPIVALPAWAVRDLSPEELNTVVLHEAAHLQRWDDWTNLLQKFIRALLFFHPAVWWIDSRLSIEREMSCDDVVLGRLESPKLYARCLVSLAEKTHAHQSLALVQAAVSHLTHTAKRISKILDGNQRTARPLLKPAIAAITVFGAASFVALQHTPQLIGFQNSVVGSARSAEKFDYVATVEQPRGAAIPASLRLPTAATRIAKPTKKTQLRQKEQQQESNIVSLRGKQNLNSSRVPQQTETEQQARFERRPPAVINASTTQDASPTFVYLVTQTETYDSFGNVTITTSVWRMRVQKPTQAARTSVLPHQT